ncbi:WD40 domain-containing protein [Coleofasciculus sp. G2-EDA-02]|uniref:WD40 domain-containing protein n=1 Tax=Coleofasciculus sp. G2-EDA-02 TaxID=3069529 RepID=UPI0032F78D0B
MIETKQPENVTDYNQSSLNALDRAIAFSQGEFSLVLVRCNYKLLQKRILHQLHERAQGRYQIQQLVLPESVTTLYTTIQNYVGMNQQGASGNRVVGRGFTDNLSETTDNLTKPAPIEESGRREDCRDVPVERLPVELNTPPALIILGLESVEALKDLLTSTNQVRDEFRKRLPFPLVLWVNDEVLHKLVRSAPDFSSWAATPIKFEIATDELLDLLQHKADSLFRTVLKGTPGRYAPWRICTHHANLNLATGCRSRAELDCALHDLQQRQETITPELEASLQFVLGQYDYANDHIDAAVIRYQKSLRYWRITNNLERQGVLLFHLGLCYCRNADLHRAQRHRNWEEAWPYLQQAVEAFEWAERPDLVAQFITQQAEVLQHLEGWDSLQQVAKQCLQVHQRYGSPIQLAQDYGFLAEVALVKRRWRDANHWAQQALSQLASVPNQPQDYQGLHPYLLTQLYQLILVKSYHQLHQSTEATHHLNRASQDLPDAIAKSDYHYEPQRYLYLLESLRRLYFEQQRYLEAFEIKQEQGAVEQLYGFRAFIGAARLQPRRAVTNPTLTPVEQQEIVAQEIAASGRQQDVQRLIERLSRADCQLTVIHGPSGVGKSSIVSAGLVPALKHRALGDRLVLPVVLQVYTDWIKELNKNLRTALSGLTSRQSDQFAATQTIGDDSSDELILNQLQAQLHDNADRNILTVLIFDQFEEFFLGHASPQQTRLFYQFFQTCLDLSFVKIIVSIREDFLHYLLEFEKLDLEVIENNILDRKNRYPLGNFSPPDARAVIQSLTERAHFYLESTLIDELVRDLARELGEVRPIELQVVGAQLQAENITTLAQYRQRGPVEKLAERFLEKALKDCGVENEQAAWLVLQLLTDENNNRPLKTRAELVIESDLDIQKLDLILEILEKSGLVFLLPEIPSHRYQLVHDYLVEFIRQNEQNTLRKELEELRQKDKDSQNKIQQLIREKTLRSKLSAATKKHAAAVEKQHQAEEKLNQVLRRRLQEARIVGVTLATLAVIAVGLVWRAVFSETNAQLIALNASAEALVASNRKFDALLKSLSAAKELKQALGVTKETKMRVISTLQQVVYGVRERNRLTEHSNWVSSVSFSPDGELIASASKDKTIKLWSQQGKLLQDLLGHKEGVYAVRFSPQGQILASASEDNTIKLWSREGTLLRTLTGHRDRVHSISFSPDGQRIVSASEDNTIKLWHIDGTLLRTLSGHNHWVLDVNFSANGQLIASASRDKTIKLWQSDGTLLKTLTAHNQPVLDISFSPDGEYLLSASADKTIKLWRTDGTLLNTLSGHQEAVITVAYSPDGQIIASGSEDNTIKLWHPDGRLIDTLQGHGKAILGLGFSPSGKILASASADNTIKLWQVEGGMLQPIPGHSQPISSISFSPNGERIATASWDNTVKLWTRQGKLLKTIAAHQKPVNSVSFSDNGKTLATGSDDTTIKLWNQDGTWQKTLSGHQDGVTSVNFSPDGQRLASSSTDQTVKLWQIDGRLDKTLIGHQGTVWGVTFSPDGSLIASASEDKTVKLWSRNGRLIKTLRGHRDAVNWVTFSPDGELIASASSDRTVNLWNREGELLRSLKGHNGLVNWVTFSPDGEFIASASDDKTVNLWSRHTGHLINSFVGHKDAVFGVSFSPDGKILASASQDTTVILWNLDLADLVGRSCSWLEDYLQNNSESPRINDANPQDFRALCAGR